MPFPNSRIYALRIRSLWNPIPRMPNYVSGFYLERREAHTPKLPVSKPDYAEPYHPTRVPSLRPSIRK